MSRLVLCRFAASVLFLVVAANSEAAAQVPRDYRGTWASYGSSNASCKVTQENPENISITADLLQYSEGGCGLKNYTSRKGGIEVSLACDGEGSKWRVKEIWTSVVLDGRTILIRTEVQRTEGGRTNHSIGSSLWVRCQ